MRSCYKNFSYKITDLQSVIEFMWPVCCKYELPILWQCKLQASMWKQYVADKKVEHKKKWICNSLTSQVAIQFISCSCIIMPPAHHSVHENMNELPAPCVTLVYPNLCTATKWKASEEKWREDRERSTQYTKKAWTCTNMPNAPKRHSTKKCNYKKSGKHVTTTIVVCPPVTKPYMQLALVVS